jgi:hypothetical protein
MPDVAAGNAGTHTNTKHCITMNLLNFLKFQHVSTRILGSRGRAFLALRWFQSLLFRPKLFQTVILATTLGWTQAVAREGDITINATSTENAPCDNCPGRKGRKICYELTLAANAEQTNRVGKDFHVLVNSASSNLFRCFTTEVFVNGVWEEDAGWSGEHHSQVEGNVNRHYASWWQSVSWAETLARGETMRFCMVYCGDDANLDNTIEYLVTHTGATKPSIPFEDGNRANVPYSGTNNDPGWKGTKTNAPNSKVGFLLSAEAPFEVINLGRNHQGVLVSDVEPGAYTLIGGGNDAWDNLDECTFAAEPVFGDFDVRVRVESLEANSGWTKAGLMVRENLSESARMVFNRVTPPPLPANDGDLGANDSRFAYRTGQDESEKGGGANGGRHEDGEGSPDYPNAWLRVQRTGSMIFGYRSDDGVNWILQGSQDTATWAGGPLGPNVHVGVAVSRGPGGNPTARAEFRDYRLTLQTAAPPLQVLSASSEGNPNRVTIRFGRMVRDDGTNLWHYTISPGSVSNAVFAASADVIHLTTSRLIEGRSYTLTVSGLTDRETGLPLMPDPATIQFVHGSGYEARRIAIQRFDYLPGPTTDLVLSSSAYARDLPDAVYSTSLFEDITSEAQNDFSGRIFGVLNITNTGDYRFFACSDDQSRLYLSTDDQPANKMEIAREPEWNNARQYATLDRRGPNRANVSAPVRLEAGKRYFLEQVFAEGFQGNNASVAWQAPGAPEPGDGASPIPQSAFVPARYFKGTIFYSLGAARIMSQPAEQTVGNGLTATFTVRGDGTPPYSYQWQQRNGAEFADIPGATAAIYAHTASLSDHGSQFRCVVSNPFSGTASAPATLMVSAPLPLHDFVAQGLSLISAGEGFYEVTPHVQTAIGSGATNPVPLDFLLMVNGELRYDGRGARTVALPPGGTGVCPDSDCLGKVCYVEESGQALEGTCSSDCICSATHRLETIPLALSPGDVVQLVLDPDQRVIELNEANNVFVLVTPSAQHDFAARGLNLSLVGNGLYEVQPQVGITVGVNATNPVPLDFALFVNGALRHDGRGTETIFLAAPCPDNCVGACAVARDGGRRQQTGECYTAGRNFCGCDTSDNLNTIPLSLLPGDVVQFVLDPNNRLPELDEANNTFTITVPNHPPVLASLPNQAVHVGTMIQFRIPAVDPDGPTQALTYTLEGAPEGASIDPVTGEFQWQATAAHIGTSNLVVVRVTDNGQPPFGETRDFIISVAPPPIIVGSSITNGSLELTWSSVPGNTYRIEAARDLSSGVWTEQVGNLSAQDTLASWSLPAASTIGYTFYRIALIAAANAPVLAAADPLTNNPAWTCCERNIEFRKTVKITTSATTDLTNNNTRRFVIVDVKVPLDYSCADVDNQKCIADLAVKVVFRPRQADGGAEYTGEPEEEIVETIKKLDPPDCDNQKHNTEVVIRWRGTYKTRRDIKGTLNLELSVPGAKGDINHTLSVDVASASSPKAENPVLKKRE